MRQPTAIPVCRRPASRRRLPAALGLIVAAALAVPADAAAAWVWPVSGEVITPYRNGTDPYATGQHRGIDIAAPVGTPVVAAADGDVRFAGTAGSSGLTISIRTGDGYDTSYLHLSSLSVRAGAHVSTGDRIGAVGTTGVRSATAPHLHFGVRAAGTRHDYRDPMALLPPPPPARAPDPPPPPPAIAPQPVPPAPRTVPLASPAPPTAPRHVPRPRAIPHGVPALRAAPQAAPRAHAIRVSHAAPLLGAGPTRRRASHGARGPRSASNASAAASHAASMVGRVSDGLPASRNALGEVAGAGTVRPRPVVATTPPPAISDGRFKFGWMAACAALLLIAGLLGVARDGGAGTSRRIRALPYPLTLKR
jgi:hypothetical protein